MGLPPLRFVHFMVWIALYIWEHWMWRRQAPNVKKMKMLGAEVVPVHSGNKTLKDATNEAIRDWINHPVDTHYIIGSVVGPHPYPDMVTRFQSVISEEIRVQLKEKTGTETSRLPGGLCGRRQQCCRGLLPLPG